MSSPKITAAPDSIEEGNGTQSARLQRALVRLIFAFHGQDERVDDNLKRLRGLLKSAPKSSSVFALLDELVEQVVAVNGKKSSAVSAQQQFAEFLNQIELTGEAANDARALQRRFGESASAIDIQRLIDETSALVNRALKLRSLERPEEVSISPDGREVLTTLLGNIRVERQALKTSLDALRQRVDKMRSGKAWLDAAEEVAGILSGALRPTPTTTSFVPTISAVKAPLIALLDKLDGGDGAAISSATIRKQLNNACSFDEVVAAATAFSDLLNEQRAKQAREFAELSAFLRDVTKRLEEFRTYLKQSSLSHDDSVRSAVALQDSMSRQVGQMCDRIEQETQLSDLKIFVLDEVNGLKSALSAFVDAERQRHEAVNESANSATDRLNLLETEVTDLRETISAQKAISMLDPLTGIYNRLGYTEGIAREYSRWQRHGGELALVMLDLDFFKSINDQFGHATGDKVLAAVAGLFRKQIRAGDFVCRIGGEEFVVVMPETSLSAATVVADKLREAVATSQFRLKDQPVPVTISCGIAAFRESDTIEQVFERADQALYQAKANGRNRYCVEEQNSALEANPVSVAN